MADLYEQLGSREQGLSDAEVLARRAESGENVIPAAPPKARMTILLEQFKSPLVYILFASCVIVALLGEWVDAGVIAFVVALNAGIGAYQEGRAQDTLAALRRFVASDAVVIRDGIERVVPDSEIVKGDLIIIREGDKVPADARIVRAKTMYVDQAALTGESESVEKKADGETDEVTIYRGTHCVRGHALAIVIATGTDTMIGSIARQLSSIDTEMPLKRSIEALSRTIIITVGIVLGLLFVIGIGRYEFRELVGAIVATAVSVIPESLPVVVTLILASGVWRMGKRQALVKRLQAVEALGQADVIAVDKTGTVTKNEMMVVALSVGGMPFEVSGDGYEPVGSASLKGQDAPLSIYPGIALSARLVGSSSDAHVAYSEADKAWKRVSGDPTEAALVVFAEKFGVKKPDLEARYTKLDEQPFTSESKYHSATYEVDGAAELAVTGSPEVVIGLSTSIWTPLGVKELDAAGHKALNDEAARLMKKGLRVIACAMKSQPAGEGIPAASSMTFVCFLGIQDAIRREATPAIAAAQAAGVRVVMITGDHQHTACAIASEIGIWRSGDAVMTGIDLDTMGEAELEALAEKATVFARVTPQHKLRIIELLKKSGHTVAMTGDGVNDALSLVRADLGIAMGKIGTQVAQEAADIVLLDDSFASIVAAIEEGRHMFISIRRTVLYLLSTNLSELCVIGLAMIFGFPIPFTPTQIIWLNLVTDSFIIAAIAAEPKMRGLMRMSPKDFSGKVLDEATTWRMIAMSIAMSMTTYFVFVAAVPYGIGKASSAALLTLISFQWFNVFNARGYGRPGIWLVLALGTVIYLQWLAFTVPWLRKALDLTVLPPIYVFTACILGSLVLVSDAAWRWYTKHTFDTTND